MSLLSVVLAAAPLVVGPELPACRLGEPVFTSEQVGFVPDACGEIFATSDGGRSWRRTRNAKRDLQSMNSLSLGVTFPDGAVVLGGYLGPYLQRSVNSDAKWERVDSPTSAWLYAMVARGQSAWACGSDGPIIRTTDTGKTWSTTKATPTDSTDRCTSLDFLDAQRGWVGGWYGSLWSTEDGGKTWSSIALPEAFKTNSQGDRTLHRVLRIDRNVGFVQGSLATWRTRDGGRHWEQLPAIAKEDRVVVSVGPHRAFATRASARAKPDDVVLDLSTHLFPRGDGAVSVEGTRVVLWERDASRRVLAITGVTSNETPRLETLRLTNFGARTAFGTKRAFVSHDEGQTWVEVGALPEDLPFEQFVLVDERRGLARSGSRTFRSENGARLWKESTAVTDAADLANALGEKQSELFPCLAGAPSGLLKLEFGVQGCFGGSSNHLELSWNEKGGELRISGHSYEPLPNLKKTLNLGEVRRLLSELHDAAVRPESTSGCTSTNSVQSSFEVSCRVDGPTVTQSLALKTNDCADRGYARPNGIYEWAMKQWPIAR
jgi:photosystem II stability/assembly factor-like uncharacterized protein